MDSEGSYVINVINASISAKEHSVVEFDVAEYSQDKTLLSNSLLANLSGSFASVNVTSGFEPRTENTKYFKLLIWTFFNATETTQSTLTVDSVSVVGTGLKFKTTGLQYLYAINAENQSIQVVQVQHISPQKIIATVNATQPFILTTTQELDRFWVAYVNGEVVIPTSLYLGLKGFMINQTGRLQITLV